MQTVSADGATLALSNPLKDEADRFESGRIHVDGVGDYEVVGNTDRGDINGDDVVVAGPVPQAAAGKQFWLYDDDYYDVRGVDTEIKHPRSLPYRLSGGLFLYQVLADAFIEPIQVPDQQYRNEDISFVRNAPLTVDPFITQPAPGRSLTSSDDFWHAHLLAAWQCTRALDMDPDSELGAGPTPGITRDLFNSGYIFVETLRENESGGEREMERRYVAHEIGHIGSSPKDHTDEGLMDEVASGDRFRPVTIRRFREERDF